jgi:hypothetical protein
MPPVWQQNRLPDWVAKTDDDAVILVDDLAKRVKVDIPKKAPVENTSKCMDSLLERQTALRVSQAKFKKAKAADP